MSHVVASTFVFDFNKYLGTWYELAHYPSWFQRNDNYNTMAHYELNTAGSINVHNSTISRGKSFDSYGTASIMGPYSLRVDFPMPEIGKLQMSNEFNMGSIMSENGTKLNTPREPKALPVEGAQLLLPNYVIDKIWYNQCGEYIFAIVTDPLKQSLYVLSRYKHPSLCAYNDIMEYVVSNYNRDLLVQTPHFD